MDKEVEDVIRIFEKALEIGDFATATMMLDCLENLGEYGLMIIMENKLRRLLGED